ncbi:hypothetical protein DFH06DRAFT_1302999 [Mycena polygramma]|nr:hypothetical protein DFH06DRAFT_1302999 [Mycena polygramma]
MSCGGIAIHAFSHRHRLGIKTYIPPCRTHSTPSPVHPPLVKKMALVPSRANANTHNARPGAVGTQRQHAAYRNDRSMPNPGGERTLHQSYQNLNNPTINNINARGDVYQTVSEADALDRLAGHIADKALHSSIHFADSESPCSPGTRELFVADLCEWASDDGQDCPSIYWVYGTAGIGKTAIARQFAGQCAKLGLGLGASFFFNRNIPECGNADKFVATVVYQLLEAFPADHFNEFHSRVQTVMRQRRSICTANLLTQFHNLLLEPFQSISGLRRPPILIFDGLDECDAPQMGTLLNLLLSAIVSDELRCRVFFFSRDELRIRQIFADPSFVDMVISVQVKPENEPIRTYYKTEFGEIRKLFYARARFDFPKHWPPIEYLTELVRRACGTFIYATTAMRFIGSATCNPIDRLADVIGRKVETTLPLDTLYDQILDSFDKPPEFISMLDAATLQFNPEDIDDLLGLVQGSSRLALGGLTSLLKLPPHAPVGMRAPTTILHSTFTEYLHDAQRSRAYCTATAQTRYNFVRCALKFLTRKTSMDRTLEESRFSEITLFRSLGCLDSCPPAQEEKLLNVLAHNVFQRSWLICYQVYNLDNLYEGPLDRGIRTYLRWLKARSPRGEMIAQKTMDYMFICEFEGGIWEEVAAPRPSTARNDGLYRGLLTEPSKVLDFIRKAMVWKDCVEGRESLLVEHLELTWLDLQPLCRLRGICGAHELFEFLSDPKRAGPLYRRSHQLREDAALALIAYTGRLAKSGAHHRGLNVMSEHWSEIVTASPPSEAVLNALATLDLTKFCTMPARMQPQYHFNDHSIADDYEAILDWLKRCDDRFTQKRQAIAFWEDLERAANTCMAYMQERGVDEALPETGDLQLTIGLYGPDPY